MICFCCFCWENPPSKTHRENPFLLSERAQFVGLRMRICYQNNGGSNISKHEVGKLWRDFFPNCAPVSLGGGGGGATDSDKVSFYLLIHVKFT